MTPSDAARRMPNLDVVAVARYYRACDEASQDADYWRALALRLGQAADRAPPGAAEALGLYALDACRRVHELVHPPKPAPAGASTTPLTSPAYGPPLVLLVVVDDDGDEDTPAPERPPRDDKGCN